MLANRATMKGREDQRNYRDQTLLGTWLNKGKKRKGRVYSRPHKNSRLDCVPFMSQLRKKPTRAKDRHWLFCLDPAVRT
jgi:hypothetical protein